MDIELLPDAAATDLRLVAEITELTNRAYAEGEEGLWVDGTTRTTNEEVSELIAAGQIALAYFDEGVVGSIRVQQLDEATGEFGMLVADPARRGLGIGRELVKFAHELSRQRDLGTMQLELLFPQRWKHPMKQYLHGWYTRIGYRPVRTGSLDEMHPHLAPLLATPCDFVVYHKPLAA